jgi:oligopeptide transport system permease protein
MSVGNQEYVLASRSMGAGPWRIISRHMIPNGIGTIMIAATFQIPGAIFTESFLSFIGLGVSVPMASLGSMASEALNGIQSFPYLLVFPAVMLSLIILSFNLLGDGLRDALDPRLNVR